uniref:Cytochrome c biogenesis protein CcsA n=1 Tax=Colemanosphaera charkowiensis TaxID=51706 RepID=A0A6C0RVQ9_9CHLO|nr:heme attachment to plastid cytochrome c [Colemanosphaera charkowiensis]
MLLNNTINLEETENFLRNATFLILFFTTIFYWIYTAFYTPTNFKMNSLKAGAFNSTDPKLLDKEDSLSQYETQDKLGFFDKANQVENTTKMAVIKDSNHITVLVQSLGKSMVIGLPYFFMIISNLLLVLLLLVRWEISGHFPLSNLYESLMFLAWCCTFLYLICKTSFTVSVEKILGSITAPSALLMNAFATFSLPKEMQESAPLVPALQSNWLMMHVTVMIISYATLIIGSLLSILFLILNKLSTSKIKTQSLLINNYSTSTQSNNLLNSVVAPIVKDFDFPMGTNSDKKFNGLTNLIVNLDALSYRIIGLGFPFLTIGILSGAVWANEAWGSYWSWDPKETWALLTWLIFAIYLHTRLTKGWQGEKPAVIASLGFLVVWFCYLGVNLIGEGLHSYGFFN